MVCAGDEDPLIPLPSREKFVELMRASGADWQFLLYSGAGHSFTDKDVDALGMSGFSYHAPTDRRSWAAMRELLEEAWSAGQFQGLLNRIHVTAARNAKPFVAPASFAMIAARRFTASHTST